MESLVKSIKNLFENYLKQEEAIQNWVYENTPKPLLKSYKRFKSRIQQHFLKAAGREANAVFLIFGAWARFFVAITILFAAIFFPEYYFSIPSWTAWVAVDRSLFLTLSFLLPAISIILYFIYAIALLVIITIKSPQQLRPKRLQVLADIVFAFVILSLHLTPINELYIMFIIPLVLAGRYLRLVTLFVIWVLVALTFGWATATASISEPELWRSVYEYHSIPLPFSLPWWLFYIWIPRMFVLTIIAGLTFYYKKMKEYVLRDIEVIIKQQWETGQALQQEYKVNKLVRLFCQKAVETIPGAENSVLHRYNPNNNMLEAKASYPPNIKEEQQMASFRYGQGIAGMALKERRVINVRRIRDDEDIIIADGYVPVQNGREYQSLLVAPLYVGDRRIGSISVDNIDPDAFGELSEHLLSVLSTQASTALANAIELSEREERQKRQKKILLYGQKLTPRVGIEVLLEKIIQGTDELLGYKNVAIFVFGFIPCRFPGVTLDENFDVGEFISNKELQQRLKSFADEEKHFRYSHKKSAQEKYDCYIPLVGVDNDPIGLLALGCGGKLPDSRDDIQDIWLYTKTVSGDIEESLSLETQRQLKKTNEKLQQAVEPKKDGETLSDFFKNFLGFQHGIVKISSFLDWEERLEPFGLSNEEFNIMRDYIMQNPKDIRWIAANRTKLDELTIIGNIQKNSNLIYFPWQDEWVQKEFPYEKMRLEGAQGFLYISAWSSQKHPVFEAVLNVSEEMEPPIAGWGHRLYTLVNSMAKTAENVRLTATQAIEDARRAEREWLRADIHDALNILQGGPMFLTAAARNELRNQFSETSRQNSVRKIEEWLKVSEKGTRFAYDSLSRIMEEFGQSTLLNQGLVEALQEFQELFLFKEKLEIKIEAELEKKLPSETKYGLYRIILEAVNNAFKHGGIQEKEDGKVIVSLEKDDNDWILGIQDNGQGFTDPVETIKSQTTSFGLRQMEKWAKMLGGNLEIESVPEGVVIQVQFNISDKDTANDRQ